METSKRVPHQTTDDQANLMYVINAINSSKTLTSATVFFKDMFILLIKRIGEDADHSVLAITMRNGVSYAFTGTMYAALADLIHAISKEHANEYLNRTEQVSITVMSPVGFFLEDLSKSLETKINDYANSPLRIKGKFSKPLQTAIDMDLMNRHIEDLDEDQIFLNRRMIDNLKIDTIDRKGLIHAVCYFDWKCYITVGTSEAASVLKLCMKLDKINDTKYRYAFKTA